MFESFLPIVQFALSEDGRELEVKFPFKGFLKDKTGQPIIGQIDRMALTREAVLIVDYKSGRPPPARAEAAPPSYLRQLAAYRALLQAIYPGLRVEAGLLWTEGPRLDWLPAALLDRHAPGSADPAAA